MCKSLLCEIKKICQYHVFTDVTVQTRQLVRPSRRSPTPNREVDLLKSLRRSRSPTPTPSYSSTPPKITLLLPCRIKAPLNRAGSLSSEDDNQVTFLTDTNNTNAREEKQVSSETELDHKPDPNEASKEEETNFEKKDNPIDKDANLLQVKSESWISSAGVFVWRVLQDVVSDFTFDDEEQEDEAPWEEDGDNLSVKRLLLGFGILLTLKILTLYCLNSFFRSFSGHRLR